MSIQGKGGSALGVAVVTGASSGIGNVYANRLAKRGYDLVLVARRKERLEALAQELEQKFGVQAAPLVADLGNEADLKRVGDALAADERITMLVNSAGTSAVKPSIDLPVAVVENQMDVNAKSVTHLSLAVLPGFVQTHLHLCQTLFRGAADDLSLIDWLKKRVWPMEAAHSAESVRASARRE